MKGLRLEFISLCAPIALLVPIGATSAAAPSNDNCMNARPVGDVTDLAFDTTNATFDGPGIFILEGPNIWYCYTASCTGCATISLLGSSFDTKLAVFDGCGCYPAAGDLIKVNDDADNPLVKQSQLMMPVTAGHKYLIEIGGFQGRSGPGTLTIECDGNMSPPPNDDCARATFVGDVTDLPFDTLCATFDGPGICRSSPNVWYRYKAGGSGPVTVSLLGSEFDTALAVYDNVSCYPNEADLIGCNDDFDASAQSQITFQALAGHDYLIEVEGYNLDTGGQGVLTISSQFPPVTSNDDCSSARPVGDVTDLPFDTTDATFDGPGLCLTSPNLWYVYTPKCTGQATVSLCGSSFDTEVAVYAGAQCYPKDSDLLGCNDDFCDLQSQLTIDVVAGEPYLIEVGGYDSETGQGVLSITCEGSVEQDKTDLGDAPDSTNNFGVTMTAYPSGGPAGVKANYPTVFNDGTGMGPYGPIHVNSPVVAYLGKGITRELEADTGPDEDGINNIEPLTDSPNHDGDDDGVTVPLDLPYCRWATFDYTVNVVDPSANLWVNVWFDWNRDGDWDDVLTCTNGPAPEWAVQNQFLFNLSTGMNKITTPAFLCWHPTDGPAEIWMRITLSDRAYKGGSNPGVKGNGGSGPRTKYEFGETEDYYFTPSMSFSVCEDINGDGVINTQDLTDLTSLWLEECPK
jgi:hypothetical protein